MHAKYPLKNDAPRTEVYMLPSARLGDDIKQCRFYYRRPFISINLHNKFMSLRYEVNEIDF